MKILLIGRNGQVAWELRRTLACLGQLISIDRRSQPVSIDLSDNDSIKRAINAVKPDIIVNAAAHTAVDKAEQEPEVVAQINGVASGVLAECGQSVGAGLVHFSTDYVLTGDAKTPYNEETEASPRSVYGHSKLEGERAIAQVGGPHLIFRTAWVYGGHGQNFFLTMLRLMAERESLNVTDDQIGAPTWSRAIAEATALLLGRCVSPGKAQLESVSGIYNMSCGGAVSWYDFAVKIREMAIQSDLLASDCAHLHPIPAKDYPTPAKRPAYSVLSNDKLHAAFDVWLPAWDEAFALCLEDYADGKRRG